MRLDFYFVLSSHFFESVCTDSRKHVSNRQLLNFLYAQDLFLFWFVSVG